MTNKKRKWSEEAKKRRSGSGNPMYSYKWNSEQRKLLSDSKKGNLNPSKRIEVRKKISESKKGCKGYWKGKKRPEMSGKNNPFYGVRFSGEKHWNWKGGIGIYPYDWTDELKESIRGRDNYTCQECGIHQDESEKNFDVHHIDYNKDNLDPKNLITLCKKCHMKTNFNRESWKNYFYNI